MHKDCKEILVTGEQITKRSEELGKLISEDYAGKELTLVGLLKGSVPFLAELSKYITIDVYFDYMDVSSYDGVTSSGNIVVETDLSHDIKGKHILIVEDILDTGKTLATIKPLLLDRGAASVEIATLLLKLSAYEKPITAKYVGFEVPDAFVIGFGLDYNQKYRNLPYVGVLKEEVYK